MSLVFGETDINWCVKYFGSAITIIYTCHLLINAIIIILALFRLKQPAQ